MNDLLIVIFIGIAAGGGLYAIFYQRIVLERRSERRLALVKVPFAQGQVSVRHSDSQPGILKAFGEKGGLSSLVGGVRLKNHLEQAGLAISPVRFSLLCLAVGTALGLVAWIGTSLAMAGALAAGAGGILAPLLILKVMRGKRLVRLVQQLPVALEAIVRGTRVGIPVAECLAMISRESDEPIASEFRRVAEAQKVGFTVSEAVLRMTERIPSPEYEFFASVIAIQQRTGGNLSDALHNLARLLRDRRRLRERIKAISMEAKSSAGIIGSLPFVVIGLISATAPDYMTPLFTTQTGWMIIAGCLGWMLIGIVVMRAMINFEI